METQDWTTKLHDGPPRPATLKRINMRRFLEELRRRGPSTRAELTRAIGVAPPTSSAIIADLLDSGWLEPAFDRPGSKGRPGKVFRLATSSCFVVGALIQVDRVFIAPAGLDGRLEASKIVSFPTPSNYGRLLDSLAREAERFGSDPIQRCLGFGLGVPGLLDESSGVVALSPNLHYLDGRPIGQDLRERLDLDVTCTQEEHALCIDEQHFGGARHVRDFAVLDVTDGMGMGVVSGGSYMHGRQGYAGEVGHVTVEPNGVICGCGNRGCLETVATDRAFLSAVAAIRGEPLDFPEAAGLAAAGHPQTLREMERTIDYLAIALAAIANLFNPEAIFIHGKLLDLSPDLIVRLRAATAMRALSPSFADVKILRARGDKLGGVLLGLLDKVFASVGPILT